MRSSRQKLPCHLPRLDYDFISSPDLAQTIVVACAVLEIPFKFTGLASLKIKETDRIEALKRELRKLGYVLLCCMRTVVGTSSFLSWNVDFMPMSEKM